MFILKTAPLLALIPLAVATACTQSNAIDWPFGAAGDDACASYCGQDSACLQTCYEIAQQGQCNAVGCSEKRSTLDCASDEVCLRYTDGSLLCLNGDTGEYTDDVGGHGNAETGVYTSPDGSITTNLGDNAATTSTKAATATNASGSKSTTGTARTASATGTSTSTATGTSSVTSSPTGTATGTTGAGSFVTGSWVIGGSSLLVAIVGNTVM